MKKYLLALVLVFSLVFSACNSVPVEQTPASQEESAVEEVQAPQGEDPAVEEAQAPQAEPVAETLKAPTAPAVKTPVVEQPQKQSITVPISNFAFSPATLTIRAGDSVTWVNNDNVPHTVTFAAFGSNNLQRGDKYTHVFDTPGTYDYYCAPHPSMRAKVIVQ